MGYPYNAHYYEERDRYGVDKSKKGKGMCKICNEKEIRISHASRKANWCKKHQMLCRLKARSCKGPMVLKGKE
jgi:hypothetical protein